MNFDAGVSCEEVPPQGFSEDHTGPTARHFSTSGSMVKELRITLTNGLDYLNL
jgi:hypothetical protein